MQEKDKALYQKRKTFCVNFCYWGIISGSFLLLGKYVLPVLLPFVFAFAIAGLLNKPVCCISKKISVKRERIAVLFVVLFFLLAGIIVSAAGSWCISGLKNIFLILPELFEEAVIPVVEAAVREIEAICSIFQVSFIELVETNMPAVLNKMSTFIVSLSDNFLSAITGAVSSVPLFFMKAVITIVASVFIAADYPVIKSFIIRQIPKDKTCLIAEVKSFTVDTIIKYEFSYVLIFMITFLELYIGFTIMDIDYAGMIALLIAVLDILPVLGTGSILIPWSVISLFLGNYSSALEVALLYIVITIIRNIIEPKLVGKHMKLHPAVALASMLTGLHFFGVIGLFGLPLLIAFLKKLNDQRILHIFR